MPKQTSTKVHESCPATSTEIPTERQGERERAEQSRGEYSDIKN
jgi:hypothetical protein